MPANLVPDSELQNLLDTAREAGVTLNVHRHAPSLIELIWFQRKPHAPKGSGARFLQALCDLCDSRGTALDLGVDPTNTFLPAYYARFGFEPHPARQRQRASERLGPLRMFRRQAQVPEPAPETTFAMAI